MSQSRKSNKQNGSIESFGIRLLEFLVHVFVPERVREEFVGDLLEEWSSCVAPRCGKLKAFAWLCSQLVRSLIPMTRVWIRGVFFGDNAMFQRQNVPRSVKMVAAVCLLGAVINCFYSFFFFSTAVFAPLAFLKGLFGIAVAVGVLNLKEGWRIFLLVITGLGLLVLPFYFLAMVFSSEFTLLISKLSGVDSRAVGLLAIAIGFAMCLWIFRTLMRPDVKRAFEAGWQETLTA